MIRQWAILMVMVANVAQAENLQPSGVPPATTPSATVQSATMPSATVQSATVQSATVQSALEIFYDFEVFRLLPRKWAFENIEDKLLRSNDGRTLYLGPSSEKVYFVINPSNQVQRLEAPSTGKAYLNAQKEFVLWYDSLDQGIFFKDRETLHIAQPLRSRFGVSYDLAFSYLYNARETHLFRGLEKEAILHLEGVYVYKVAAAENHLWTFGFSYLGHEESRTHQSFHYQKVNGEWLLMERFGLPEHLTLMDVNPFDQKALFINDAEIAPQAFEMDLRSKGIKGLGLIEQWAIYLHSDFRIIHKK